MKATLLTLCILCSLNERFLLPALFLNLLPVVQTLLATRTGSGGAGMTAAARGTMRGARTGTERHGQATGLHNPVTGGQLTLHAASTCCAWRHFMRWLLFASSFIAACALSAMHFYAAARNGW